MAMHLHRLTLSTFKMLIQLSRNFQDCCELQNVPVNTALRSKMPQRRINCNTNIFLPYIQKKNRELKKNLRKLNISEKDQKLSVFSMMISNDIPRLTVK